MKKYLSIISLFLFAQWCIGQITIMPIPFYKKGEDRRLLIEDDPCYRMIETKIKNEFLKQSDIELIDYLTALNNLDATDRQTAQNQSDIITLLVQSSNPDIYIVVDIENQSKRGNAGRPAYTMTINLNAKWNHNGKFLGGDILYSGERYFGDCFLLVEKTFQQENNEGEKKIKVFVSDVTNKLQPFIPKIDSTIEANQSISVEFYLSEDSEESYFSRLSNDEMLFSSITNWIKEKSVDKIADADMDDKYLRFQEIKIPLYVNNEERYTPANFMIDFLEHFSKLTFKTNPEQKLDLTPTKGGNKITFTLH